jgi:hypothetical protein
LAEAIAELNEALLLTLIVAAEAEVARARRPIAKVVVIQRIPRGNAVEVVAGVEASAAEQGIGLCLFMVFLREDEEPGQREVDA